VYQWLRSRPVADPFRRTGPRRPARPMHVALGFAVTRLPIEVLTTELAVAKICRNAYGLAVSTWGLPPDH
jgi:hypothetical protein